MSHSILARREAFCEIIVGEKALLIRKKVQSRWTVQDYFIKGTIDGCSRMVQVSGITALSACDVACTNRR